MWALPSGTIGVHGVVRWGQGEASISNAHLGGFECRAPSSGEHDRIHARVVAIATPLEQTRFDKSSNKVGHRRAVAADSFEEFCLRGTLVVACSTENGELAWCDLLFAIQSSGLL